MAISHQIEEAKRRQEESSMKRVRPVKIDKGTFVENKDDAISPEVWQAILQKHKERLDYNAAYQRDLRTIKRLGLNCTVAQFRKAKEK